MEGCRSLGVYLVLVNTPTLWLCGNDPVTGSMACHAMAWHGMAFLGLTGMHAGTVCMVLELELVPTHWAIRGQGGVPSF
jgi:hypothetical protein